jgi:NAD(P)-dependent dehydrogenase (short-subunit alcohol dehydrogenase family)
MTLAGKVVLVAGVGSGLGSAVVALAAADGADVVAVARTSRALDPLVAHAAARGWKVAPRVADVTDGPSAARLVEEVHRDRGRIDGLSIDVGHWIHDGSPLDRLSEEGWSAGLRDNLEAIYRLGHAVMPRFVARRSGSLVLVSAAPAVRAAGAASYAASKAGVAELAVHLAREYRPSGVRVNAVLPGSMGSQLASLDPPAAAGPIPLRDQVGSSAWEVARAIRYLLSDESRWVTGALLTVDGGASTGGGEPADV